MVYFRKATDSDIPSIGAFVDFWLSGRGLADKVPGSAHDYFVPVGRHQKYVTKYTTILALFDKSIVGWCVKSHLGVLIHLLVAGTFRHQGIGTKLLELADPESIRSKIDQAAGDPASFYTKRGYSRVAGPRQGSKQNIEMFEKVRD
ncbi:MAG: GNAT family N-acetyltransferase [Desulfobacteraceae bacterium]|nr:GNAT family N-acetyltransferase [Desulfobacteraceae bacterium]